VIVDNVQYIPFRPGPSQLQWRWHDCLVVLMRSKGREQIWRLFQVRQSGCISHDSIVSLLYQGGDHVLELTQFSTKPATAKGFEGGGRLPVLYHTCCTMPAACMPSLYQYCTINVFVVVTVTITPEEFIIVLDGRTQHVTESVG
jgi:hypothetical protein